MSESMNLHGMIRSAMGVAANYPGYENSIMMARLLSGLMVPALKQVSGYNQQPRIYTHPAVLTTDGAAANETDTETIRFTSNSDFLMTGLSCINGTNGQTAYNYELQLVFGANDRNLVNLASGIHVEALMGADRVPWAFPKAFAIRKNSSLTFTITTTTTIAVVAGRIYLFGIDYLDGNVLDATRRAVG